MRISILGTGNVASQLALALHRAQHAIVQVYGRDLAKAEALAQQVSATACAATEQLRGDAEIYILAIKDDALPQMAEALAPLSHPARIFAHTSGATPQSVLATRLESCGVFYPLQTFTRGRAADFEELPLCVDANSPEACAKLLELAQSICPHSQRVTDAQRERLHVAAVLVNNFSNHLFALAADYCQQEGVDFQLLMPLIRETVRKLDALPPDQAQTGAARRRDLHTIARHQRLLEADPALLQIYNLLSESILNKYRSR